MIYFTDEELLAVSNYITNERELQEVGVQLGLGLHEIDSIRTDHRDHINQAACEVLRVWRDNSRGHITHEMKSRLKSVLKKVGVPIQHGLL